MEVLDPTAEHRLGPRTDGGIVPCDGSPFPGTWFAAMRKPFGILEPHGVART